jgi:hypothetical protein
MAVTFSRMVVVGAQASHATPRHATPRHATPSDPHLEIKAVNVLCKEPKKEALLMAHGYEVVCDGRHPLAVGQA